MKKNYLDKFQYYFFISLFIFYISSCVNSSELDKRDKENELLKEEIKQKEKELILKVHDEELQRQNDSLKLLIDKPNQSLADKFESVKKSIYLIYTTSDASVSQGSAFVINSNGDAISNYHVFENASTAIAINSEGKRFVIDKIYVCNKEKDYIIFRIGPDFSGVDFVKFATIESRIGDECFAIGNPKELAQSLSKGIISGYREDRHLIQTTAQITHGSSGGALFNNNGEVIGITSSGMGEADLNFAVNIKDLPLNNYNNSSLNSKIVLENTNNDEESKIKETVQGYFIGMEKNNNTSINYLSNILDRCYMFYNITKEDAMKNDYEYKSSKGIEVKSCDVDWNSLLITKKNDGFTISFNMLYTMLRREINKPNKFNLKLFMELNSNYKIKSVYENILDKH